MPTENSTPPPAQMNSNGPKASPPTPPPAPAPRAPLPQTPSVMPQSSKPAVETPSEYLKSLASMPADYLTRPVEVEPILKQPYKPVYYFFYGTLTQPKILSHILDLKQPPVLRPAKVVGYTLTNWGQYRALIDGKPGEEVTGYAYLVGSIDDELKLAKYETNAYEPVDCRIQFTDNRTPENLYGMTFKYAGDAESLKAGKFDRKLWELQMGTRLSEKWRAKGTHLNS
ncbi:hypothetical protein KVR01_012985 [Diaporthe batatas]|uniref:uncharacterized protein n=1 Tax=Diaporthe batatas TaxID=748121 RepID=UPI001D03C71E|nr:uncharacterized protein KVR01_012985 [Diaporthe batatas]KAG8157277.1 hypothetical protein KVR01_012985 [Diaporthe batatas]